jgi:FkbM family methyltransferase
MDIEKIRLLIYKYPILRELLYPVISMRRFLLQRVYSFQEKVYQRLCELLIEDPIIKVPEFQGVFVVDYSSDLFKRLLINKAYEPSLVNLVIEYLDKDRDAIDVGANIGFYTVLFAKNLDKGKVLSIEPTRNALHRLYKNIQLNNIVDKVIVFAGAVLDYVGRGQIKTLDGKEEYSTLGHWKHLAIKNENFTTYMVEVSTIDDLVSKYSLKPGFMKIDVEGMEHLVLKGSKTTLENKRPVILCELIDYLLKQNGSSSLEVINFLKSLDYIVIDAETPEIKPGSKKSTNILSIPKELYKQCKNDKFS